ncbi:MAG: lipoprotein [Haloplanus sp.]
MPRLQVTSASRRRLLLGIGATVALAGCQGTTDRPAPISLHGGVPDQCGTGIDRRSGPLGPVSPRNAGSTGGRRGRGGGPFA